MNPCVHTPGVTSPLAVITVAEKPVRSLADEARERWIRKCVDEAPPLSDAQLKSIGTVLGIRLTRKYATQA
ncbi:hypothetical protein [Streptomyces sp. NPDC088178]|uniref:hypothetical protein n=1 Tax=Streptomyces sp. NPDC088178 TaxID=3365836 RepID=UPI0037FC32D9